jgi:hypothetical protein
MKAISLWQPYASLIGRGKSIETRHWETNYRGPLAIHAAKTQKAMHLCDAEPFYSRLFTGELALGDMPFGGIVAVCTLENCIRTFRLQDLPEPERSFGDYTLGRYGWILRNIRILKDPIPMRGQQGFWEVDLSQHLPRMIDEVTP